MKIALVVLTSVAFLLSAAAMTMAIVNLAKQPARLIRRFAKPVSGTRE